MDSSMSALESAGSLLDDSQRGDSQQVKEGSSETLSTVAASEAIEEEALDDTVERRIKQPHALGDHGQWPDSTTVAADVGAVNIPSGECTPPSGGGGNGGEVVESSIKRINDNIDNIIAAVASNATAVTPEQQQQHAHHHQEEQQQHQSSDTLLFDDAASATNNNDMMTMINLQPDTTLSLDQEETVSDLEKSPEPETNKNRRYNALMMNDDEVSARVDPDDPNNNNKNTNEDSSDDDSSYFADPSHLPKPKSERRYSWSSNNSATAAAAAPSSLNTTHPISNGGSATAALTNSPRHHSQHNHHHHHQRNHSITAASVGRESDASLSLSDDSEDEGLGDHDPHQPPAMFPSHPPMDQQQQQQPHFVYPPVQQQQQQHYVYSHQQPPQLQGQPFPQQQQQPAILYEHQQKQHQFIMPPRGGVPELYPEQIMPRMHSVSSLVSTSSQNSSSSDTSVKDELRNVAIHRESHQGGPLEQQQRVVGRNAPQQPQQHIPSGRLVPILGEHPPSRSGGGGTTPIGRLFLGSPSTVNQRPSPPPISQTYSGDGHITHPQPMTAEQLATWVELSTSTPPSLSSSSKRQHNQQPMISSYTTSVFEDQQRVGDTTKSRNIYSAGSAYSRDSDLVYSGDSDVQQQQRQSSNSKARGEPQGVKNKTLHGSTNLPPSRRSLGDINVSSRSIDGKGFTLYWQRWLMLMYMSLLNLLSDWTCYSVAPIALLTEEAFGRINAEQLVVVFLCANGVATACEPIILSRLGLRRTVLFGALLLMIGSIVKSGGMPPIIQADLQKGEGEWRVYLGFLLVGLSQPLYQCTPALLSASWFPEAERTLATSVALNSNQLGIGFAFIFGTLLVKSSDDIPKYFGLLSIISTLAFLGTLIQFDDAPPTPPSDTARVMRGTLEVNVPSVEAILKSVRMIGANGPLETANAKRVRRSIQKDMRRSSSNNVKSAEGPKIPNSSDKPNNDREAKSDKRRSSRREHRGSSDKNANNPESSSSARRRSVRTAAAATTDAKFDAGFHGLAPTPSPARWDAVGNEQQDPSFGTAAALSVASSGPDYEDDDLHPEGTLPHYPPPYMIAGLPGQPGGYNPYMVQSNPYQYQVPYWDPQYANYAFFQQQQQQQQAYQQHGYLMPPPDPYFSYYNSYQHGPSNFATHPPSSPYHIQPIPSAVLPPVEQRDEGAEPVITMLPHQLDINIRDDQIWLSTRACLARPGFIHSLVSFTVSGIVINTLSTFMDYLVRLNGAGREFTGIVGGTFQFVIMISSLLIGKVCDNTRAYYSITIGMLVMGAFGLAECGVSLDANRGVSLRWSLIFVALLVGPLQPVSTELGVDVVYPLSENTVLVIQQLFSNVLSAAFIPCFKAMKDIGTGGIEAGGTERPQYTFSFYLLIVLHAAATVFFATFNGRYLRYEHELDKKAQEEQRKKNSAARAFRKITPGSHIGERAPLVSPVV